MMKKGIVSVIRDLSPLNNRTEMPKWVFVIKKALAFLLCYWAGLLVAEGAVILLHFACGKNIFNGEMFEGDILNFISCFGLVLPIVITLLYWKLIEKKPLPQMGLTRQFGNYFIGAAAGIVLVTISVIAVMLTGSIRFAGFLESPDIVMIAVQFGGFIIQGAMEEILCRGLVLHSLKDKTGLPVAVGISTLAFIYPHLSTLGEFGPVFRAVGILNLALVSLIFSFVTVRFKSLWAACGLHTLWNACLYCVMGLDLSGGEGSVNAVLDLRTVGESILNGGKYGIESSIVTAAVLAVCAVIMWYVWLRKPRKLG